MKRCIFLLLFALTACGEKSNQPWLGYAEGEDAFIAAPAAGWVANLGVERGQEVKPGDVLFTLNDTQEKAARDQAAANLANMKSQLAQNQATVTYAEKDLARQNNLVRAQAGTQALLDLSRSNRDQAVARISQMRAQEAQAEAALADAEYQLSQRRIVSLVGGRVEDIYFRVGEYVPPSTPVLSVLPPKNIYVRFFVPESQFGHVKIGRRVRISCDGCAPDLTATITFMAQQEEFTPPVIFSIGNREKLVFKLEARAPGGLKINPGEPVEVRPL
ncbi:MAG TPA: efflux RND transporter periplasmic adaptor subunit [Rhizomicrobium sp.]|jgi:HlyD family secretion protein|nr:efflux RND transporter periplasmic adaptor subunit [Rhizomicrobium sp.]